MALPAAITRLVGDVSALQVEETQSFRLPLDRSSSTAASGEAGPHSQLWPGEGGADVAHGTALVRSSPQVLSSSAVFARFTTRAVCWLEGCAGPACRSRLRCTVSVESKLSALVNGAVEAQMEGEARKAVQDLHGFAALFLGRELTARLAAGGPPPPPLALLRGAAVESEPEEWGEHSFAAPRSAAASLCGTEGDDAPFFDFEANGSGSAWGEPPGPGGADDVSGGAAWEVLQGIDARLGRLQADVAALRAELVEWEERRAAELRRLRWGLAAAAAACGAGVLVARLRRR